MPWSPSIRRWLLAISALGAAHAWVLSLASIGVQAPKAPPPLGALFSLAAESEAHELIESLPWVRSPVLFALPNAASFSGAAWLQYRPPTLPEPSVQDAVSWKEFDPSILGMALNDAARQSHPPASEVAEHPIAWREKFPVDVIPVRTSRLVVEGPIATRRLLNLPDLPAWPHSDIVANSQIQVVVDRQGLIVSAALIEENERTVGLASSPSSRLLEADRFALEVARTIRFAPVRSKAPEPVLGLETATEWGRLVFHWSTLVATNSARIPPL